MTTDEREALVESVKAGALKVEIPLRFPVQHLTKSLTSITLRRPTVADVMDTSKRDGSPDEISLLARISELGPDAIRSLDLSDYDVVTDVLVAFKY
jgi:hypothetical protein